MHQDCEEPYARLEGVGGKKGEGEGDNQKFEENHNHHRPLTRRKMSQIFFNNSTDQGGRLTIKTKIGDKEKTMEKKKRQHHKCEVL